MKRIDSATDRICVPPRTVQLPERKITIPYHVWCFTDAEKATIRSMFEGRIHEEKLIDFIDRLEIRCDLKKLALEQPKRVDMREMREDLLDKFKGILKCLGEIHRGEINLERKRSIYDVEHLLMKPKEWNSPLSMYDIIQPLEEYVKYLEEIPEEPKRTGREPADSDQFIRHIAEIYSEYIGEPTGYSSSNSYIGGSFYELVQEVLGILGLPNKDPSKQIRAALRKK